MAQPFKSTSSSKGKALAQNSGAVHEERSLPTLGTEIEQSPVPQSLALYMGLPSARLDIVLGRPHPLLVALVRHLARATARADYAADIATAVTPSAHVRHKEPR
jgi:hypothetical protein